MNLLKCFVFAAFATLLMQGVAHAASYTVTRFDDPVPAQCTAFSCSLRDAIARANSNPGVDRIGLRAGTYALTRIDSTPYSLEAGVGALWVTESVTVYGAGAGTTRVRWSAAPHNPTSPRNELFAVDQDAAVSLDIRDLSLSDGRGPYGGCIRIHGPALQPHQLTLHSVTLERCRAASFGGALSMSNSNLTMRSVQFLNNSANSNGGAIALSGHGDINVVSSGVLISNNVASNGGGAIQINGSPVPTFPQVLWVDDGSLRILGNSAASGGAIGIFFGTLMLESTGASTGNWIEISGNTAQQGGAVHINSLQPQPLASFSGVRFLRNRAQTGGAFSSNSPIQLSHAEFADNSADAGDGGAIRLSSSGLQIVPSVFEQVSFRNNRASGGGGAVFSGCGGFDAINVSFGDNGAAAERGQAIENTGPALLRHATVHNNVHPTDLFGSPGIQQLGDANCGSEYTQMRLANSLVTDYCGFNIARLVSDGGNQFGPNAMVCRANASDARQSSDAVFGLANGSFGGPFEFWGWNANQIVPQRNFGMSGNCTATDIRGLARSDGACDAGAFEQQP